MKKRIRKEKFKKAYYEELRKQGLFDAEKTISTSTGAETNSTIRIIPIDTIEVTPNSKYYMKISNEAYEFFNIHCYDSNKVWLGDRQYFNMGSISGTREVEFTVPSDANYIKVVLRKDGDTTITAEDIELSGIQLYKED